MQPNKTPEPTAVRRCVLFVLDFCSFIGLLLPRFTLPWLGFFS